MNYVQFHIGDWDSATRLLTPVEKGIYIDLLMLYYSMEKPLIRSYFDRITKAYTDEEKKAFDYVISTFFVEKEDGFHNIRCDTEIAAYRDKSEKAKKSVSARWKKEKAKKEEAENNQGKEGLSNERNTDVVRTNNERNTDEILTNNHKPITNIYKKDISKDISKKAKNSEIQKPDEVSQQTWDDFQKLRKAHKAPLTATALNRIRSQAEIAGMSLDDVLALCCQRGWRGFEASWLNGHQNINPATTISSERLDELLRM